MPDVDQTSASDTAAAADARLYGVSFNAYYVACSRLNLALLSYVESSKVVQGCDFLHAHCRLAIC